jgi:hypothetical protein
MFYLLPILITSRPPPVSPVGAINSEFGFIQHPLPLPDVPKHSDLDGLNLNITIPCSKDGSIATSSKLPVYVFVHGGGFAVGSSWYPHYDPELIVKLSAELGKPLIGITIKSVHLWTSDTLIDNPQLSSRCLRILDFKGVTGCGLQSKQWAP